MDIESFLNRTSRTKADLLRDLGMDPKSSLISSYQNGRSNPSFDVVGRLLKLGMAPIELFGKEIDDILRKYYQLNFPPKNFDNPDFIEGMANVNNPNFKENIERIVMQMKSEGKI